MKKGGLIHGRLSELVAAIGPDELFAIGHRGLSARPGQELVDLAFAPGRPAMLDVLDAILPEIHCAEILCPEWLAQERFSEARRAVLAHVDAQRLKPTQPAMLISAVERARFVIRAGDDQLPLALAIRAGRPWSEEEECLRTGAPFAKS